MHYRNDSRRRWAAVGSLAGSVALLYCPAAIAQEDSGEGASENIPEHGGNEAAVAPISSSESESARLYVTNAERREVGRKHPLTPWLGASALVEIEWQSQTLRPSEGGTTDRSREATANVQLGLVADLWESATAEAVLEYDSAIEDVVADEAFLSLEVADWEMEAGRLYTPLGIYISHFASGPMLAFAESRVEGAALAFKPTEALELNLMAYRGRARPVRGGSRGLDWALRWEGSLELEDAPAHQVGLGLTWRPTQRASLTVEYLHGWFSGSLATNSRDEPYARTNRIGAKLSFAF